MVRFGFAFLLSAALLLLPALAEDLASPTGQPWWQRLAQCGGMTLALRDSYEKAKRPSADIGTLTRKMNDILDAAAKRLMKDRTIEESAAKRTVYQTAGAKWQEVKGREHGEDLDALEAACVTDLATYKALP